MKRYLLIFFLVITIPLFLAAVVWQSNRYVSLKQEIDRLEKVQTDWVEGNKRLIAGIAVLSSTERIEHIALKELGLHKINPEDILQIKLAGGKGFEF